VTVVYPFLPAAEVTDEVVDERGASSRPGPPSVRFDRCDRFPGVLFLAPSRTPFRQLIADLVHRWPRPPPYGGEFADPVPHLTVAHQGRSNRTRRSGTSRPGYRSRPPFWWRG
jgi:hypothetical protein